MGRVKAVRTYCVVNGYTCAESTYGRNSNGTFTEKHFDEHHRISGSGKTVPRSRIGEIISRIPILAILEAANREEVEGLVGKVQLKHI